MGKVLSVATSKVQRFNVENRAHRLLAQDKVRPAPKFDSTVKDLERVLKDHPEIIEQAGKKDSNLDDRLKKVFVTSSEYLEQKRYINPEKPLPLTRTTPEDFEYGFQETDSKKVAIGKCTLRQAMQFISDHQQYPNEWTPERIASEFKLKQKNVNNILENYRMFSIQIAEQPGNTKKLLFDPFQQKDAKFSDLLEAAKGTAYKKNKPESHQE